MLVITKNAEKTLYTELKSCWESSPALRCLQLKFSQLEEDKEELLTKFLTALRVHLDDASCQVYLCHDHDVFVLTRQMTQKRLDEFLDRLAPHLSPASSSSPREGLAALFEIGVDWPRLRVLCEKKIENLMLLHSRKQQKEKEDIAQISREDLLKKLDQGLISSLATRRDTREKPEIMIVEDDLFSQKLVSNALKNKYSLSISSDGQGALMNYINKAPDVLFLDIGLPDMNGHEVLERLFEFDPDAYVVMFSGNGDKENIMKAIELGAKGFVGKPFTQDKILQYIEKSPFIRAKTAKKEVHTNAIQ